jgi:hypothetical protein
MSTDRRFSPRGRYRLTAEEIEQRRAGRRIGNMAAPAAINLLITIVLDKDAPLPTRVRCAENLLDRFGHPRLQQLDIDGDVGTPVSAVEANGMLTQQGVEQMRGELDRVARFLEEREAAERPDAKDPDNADQTP